MMDCAGVRSNDALDRDQADREREARQQLLAIGADGLDRRPWQPEPIPPSAIDLIRFFLWKSADVDVTDAAEAALRLLPAARAELDQLEAGLLFEARSIGLTWAQMASALGLNSPQACQQRLERLTARSVHPADPLTYGPADGPADGSAT